MTTPMTPQNEPVYTFDLFQQQALRTAKEVHTDEEIGMEIIHAALGIASEAGELATSVKRWVAYGQPLDVENIIEEAGDCLWFIAMLMWRLNLPMEAPALSCIAKLYQRFPEKFTEADAIARADKVTQ